MKTGIAPLMAAVGIMAALCAAADVAVEKTATGFAVRSGDVRRTLDFYGPNTLRVKSDLGRDHWRHPSLAIVAKPSAVAAKLRETADAFVVEGAAFTVSIDRRTGALTFSDKGKVLLREPSDPCTIKEINIDGEPTYEVTQRWKLEDGEGLYGLGQAASGKFNLRGQKIKIVQTNIPAFSPVWSSSKGYMILWDVYSQSIFDDKADGLSLWGESAPGGSDWYFMYGADPDRRFAEYRMLTGAAPMFPKAAFGYFQSKERYKSAQELIDVVSRFRELGYPIDWIVQDWQYWDARDDRWNAMRWDKSRFPDPKGLCDTLHNDLHVKLITSIWPDVGDDTDVARELDSHKLRYAPGHWISKNKSHVYDAYSKLGREIYFKHLKKGLIDVGVDAMWMDGSELETRDACHNADKMVEQIKACGRNEMGDFTRYLNTYGLVTTMGNYEGQRATSDKRTFTLTRTAWAGLQRYAAIPWSGDTGASWGRLKDDIAGGLGASMSGLPYWTQDTGGFFCGHYGDAMNNPEFLELLARWNQFAIFNPVYRWHVSSPVAKEPFRAKVKHPEYYESFLSAARLRYRLLPYIYSLARDVHETGRPFVRPAWIDFPGTPGANDDQTSIVFGPSLYTSVITRPVYTGHTTGSGSPVPSEMLTTPDGKAGVKVEYFKGQNHKEKVSETVVAQVNDTWPGPPLVEWPEGLTGGDDFSVRYTGRLTFSKPGTYELGVEGDDGFALWLDGEEKFRDWAKQAARSKATRVTVPEGGKAFDFRIDYFNDKFDRSVKFWMRTPEEVAKLEQESRKIEVALPVGADWYDFRTGEKFAGGTKLQREYPIDSFPLFVKAGSVLPLGPDVQYATEKTDKPTELRVYPGADAAFTLYADDNETYAYEKGAFEKIPLSWDDAKKALTIGAREGSYPGMAKTREFRVVCGAVSKTVRYDGHLVVVDLAAANAGATGASALKPVMWADVPDVAPLRVGDTYYMVSTTMHFNPGVPVMASKDLVNWKTISYCYKTIEDRPQDRLENGASDYGLGTWASSIRYNENDGFFYVTSFNNKVNSTYLFRSKDPTKSEWEFFRLSPKQYDESLWIEDGRFYVFATVPGRPYKVRLTEMKPDFSGFVDGGRIILDNVTDCAGGGGLGEGTQVFRRNGWCYIVNIGWPKGSCRCVIVHRSRKIDGPWEGRIVFEREGIAQGSFIDRPDGSWVAVLFGDRGAVGRIPYILETEWKDDWPVVQPREMKDASGSTGAKVPGCVASDEFDGGELGLQWQWNHNPDDANWSLSERRGFMRIKAGRVDGNLLQARNTLTQRTFGPACEGETCIDVSGLKEGDVAGLTLLQRLYGLAAVRVRGGKKELVLWSPDVVPTRDKQNVRINRAVRERQKVTLPDGATKVWLKAVCDFTPGDNLDYRGIPASTDKGKFYYSFDGKGWTPFGDAFDLVYTIPHFIGYRFGLCCFSTSAEGVGGFADFDYMRVSPRDDAPFTSDGSNPIVKTRFSPDPAAVVDGDWLYVFSGHDEPDARGYTMRDWGVVRTKDMKNWEDLGPVMTPAVFKWALGNNRAWASQAIKRNGKWYWYVAVYGLDPRGDCIGVAVADRPEGPWSDPIGKPIVGPGAGYIDPSVFIDDDGKAYLFWGNCGGTPGCWYAELKENMVELASEVKPVPGLMEESAFGKPLKKTRGAGARKPIDTNFEEAPWIYKLGDTYYLEYAAGGVPEYWAYSTAKSIHGPWKYGGKVMDCAEGTGTIHGGSVFFKGEWYMLYHNATLEGGADCRRSACIERYVRNPDGSIPFIPATKKGVAAPAPSVNVVTVDPSAVVGEASPDLWGLFFEDIDLSLDGGVYAEMVRNRSFEDGNGRRGELTLQYWNPVGSAECFLSDKPGAHANDRHCMTVRGRSGAGAANEGYFGMGVKKGAAYNLSFALKCDGVKAVDVALEAYGKPPLATARIEGVHGDCEWHTFTATLVANDDEAQARLVLRFAPDRKGGRQGMEAQLDHVSLFPADAVAGLFRRDLVEKLAALKPSFVRFPGGCWVEGETMMDAYRWKTTIGDKWSRRTQWNIWKYWSTNGVGFHEYLLLSEALGAKPLFCINCGMSHKETVPMDKMDEFVQDALDCIEYANGPTNSVWGSKRAAAGHPEPFGLKYLEIGNENGGKDYEARYALIAKAVREKYPEIQLVFDNWKSTKRVDDPKDLRDDHFYDSPDRFMSSLAHEYDEPKGDFGIFVGEYAVTTYTHRYGSLRGAIGEAAFMLGIERNQSQVKLAAYAPLFANAQHTAWTPNMIYPTTTGSFASPSWNVQKLFSENRGREVLKVSVETGTYETDTNFAWGKGVNHNVIENVQASAMRDAAGDIILKLVNCTEKAQQVEIRGVAGSGTRTVFTGPDRLAHNSPAEPEALKETSAPFKLEGTDTLPPLSLVIYRLR